LFKEENFLDIPTVHAEIRTKTGKGAARSLRREGKIPAILYGPEVEPVCLALDQRGFEKLLKNQASSQTPINILVENDNSQAKSALIKGIDIDPVSQNILHVDFHQFAKDRKIKVKIPVVTTGKAVGVEMGGLLQVIRRELEVFCLPMDIPETVEVDVSKLDIGDSLHVNEVQVPDNIEIPAEVNYTVVTVLSPKAKEEVEVEEVEGELEEEAEAETETEE
jgi:large subunit ribosomal protein L25